MQENMFSFKMKICVISFFLLILFSRLGMSADDVFLGISFSKSYLWPLSFMAPNKNFFYKSETQKYSEKAGIFW